MALMSYYFGILRSGVTLETIPLASVTMSRVLNAAGTFRGSFHLDMSGRANSDLVGATDPGKCFEVAEREGVPVWGGIITSRTYQSQAKSVQFTARSFEYYAEKRKILTDFSMTNEQRNIFRQLWIDVQATSEGNINVTVPSSFTTVVSKTLTMLGTDRKSYANAMEALADGDNGFDWSIDVGKNSDGSYNRTLRIGYPVLGNTDPNSIQFEYPGVILNYWATDNLTNAGTHITIIGEGEGSTMLTSTYTHSDMVSTNWLRYDLDIAKKFLNNQAAVDEHAITEGQKRKAPLTVIKAQVKGELEPQFGSYGLGDACTLIITDPRYPSTLSTPTRLVAWEYTPSGSGNVEEVSLVFVGDELNDE